MYGSGQDTVPKVRKWSGGSVVVDRPSRRSGSGRETPRRSRSVGGLSRKSRSGRGTLSKVWKRSGDTSGGPEVVGGPTQRSGKVERPS